MVGKRMEAYMRRGLVFGLFLLVACLGSARAYTLAYKDPAGTNRWYQNDITMKGSFNAQPTNETIPLDGTMKFISSEKVIRVNDDGTSTISSEISDGSMTMTLPGADKPMTMPFPNFSMTYKRSPTGKMSDMNITDKAGNGMFADMTGFENQLKMFNSAGQFEFPEGDLKAGDHWINTQSFEFMPGQKIDMKINNVVQGPRVVDGVNCLLINSEMTMEIPSIKMQITEGGVNISMEQSMSMVMKIATLFDEKAGEINRALINGAIDMTIITLVPNTEKMVVKGTMTMSGSTKKLPGPPEVEQ